MATTRIMPLHVGKGRTESRAISDIIDYVANPKKTDNGRLITGYACDSRIADAEFLLAKRQYHGVNRNGNVGTLLYVHGNLSGTYQDSKDCITIADLVEKFIQAEVSFDDVLQILKERKIVYAADATMQAMLSDKHGRTLVVEPGIGWREDEGRYSLITNYSILAPESTRPFVMPEDDRYEKASKMLNIYGNHFTVNNAFSILQAVCQEGIWATRVSFVYSAEENAVYYVQNNNFSQIGKYEF